MFINKSRRWLNNFDNIERSIQNGNLKNWHTTIVKHCSNVSDLKKESKILVGSALDAFRIELLKVATWQCLYDLERLSFFISTNLSQVKQNEQIKHLIFLRVWSVSKKQSLMPPTTRIFQHPSWCFSYQLPKSLLFLDYSLLIERMPKCKYYPWLILV